MTKHWWLIGAGIILATGLFAVPAASANQRVLAGVVGGVIVVIGLAPGRMQHDNPHHPRYRGGDGDARP